MAKYRKSIPDDSIGSCCFFDSSDQSICKDDMSYGWCLENDGCWNEESCEDRIMNEESLCCNDCRGRSKCKLTNKTRKKLIQEIKNSNSKCKVKFRTRSDGMGGDGRGDANCIYDSACPDGWFSITTIVDGALTYFYDGPTDVCGGHPISPHWYTQVYGKLHTSCPWCEENQNIMCCGGEGCGPNCPTIANTLPLRGGFELEGHEVWPLRDGHTIEPIRTGVKVATHHNSKMTFMTHPIPISRHGAVIKLKTVITQQYVMCCFRTVGTNVDVDGPASPFIKQRNTDCQECPVAISPPPGSIIFGGPPNAGCCRVSSLYPPAKLYPEELLPDYYLPQPGNAVTQQDGTHDTIRLRIAPQSDSPKDIITTHGWVQE